MVLWLAVLWFAFKVYVAVLSSIYLLFVIGGGIAGLAIAFAVKKLDPRAEVVVLERGSRTGGGPADESE